VGVSGEDGVVHAEVCRPECVRLQLPGEEQKAGHIQGRLIQNVDDVVAGVERNVSEIATELGCGGGDHARDCISQGVVCGPIDLPRISSDQELLTTHRRGCCIETHLEPHIPTVIHYGHKALDYNTSEVLFTPEHGNCLRLGMQVIT
jgi:hypothetical protein